MLLSLKVTERRPIIHSPNLLWLEGLLEVKEENHLNEKEMLEAPLMQAQRAGTCTFRSLMAFLKSKMSKQETRRFKCDIRIRILSLE